MGSCVSRPTEGAQVNTHHGRTVAKKPSWSNDSNPVSGKAGRSQVHAQSDRPPQVRALADSPGDLAVQKQRQVSLQSQAPQQQRTVSGLEPCDQPASLSHPSAPPNEHSPVPLSTRPGGVGGEGAVTSELPARSSSKVAMESVSDVLPSTLQRKNSKNAAIQTAHPPAEVSTKVKKRSPFRKLPDHGTISFDLVGARGKGSCTNHRTSSLALSLFD